MKAMGWIVLATFVSGCAPLAAGLSGAQQGFNNGRSSAQTSSGYSSSSVCTSDYSCSPGYECVKHYGATQGYCAQTTDEYGTPTYRTPRNSSIGFGNPDQCSFDGDCRAPGWYCDKGSGLRGTCVRY